MEYEPWFFARAFVVVPAQAIVGQWLASFKDYPIRQKPASFNLDEVMRKLSETPASGK
jgi:arylsulfatase